MFPPERIVELPPSSDQSYWQTLGPLPKAHDFFGDGSLFVVNAPGHLPGHINLLARVGSENWVYLGGDTARDTGILDGTAQVAVYVDKVTGCMRCAHADKEAAETHIRAVRELKGYEHVEVILAHDHQGLAENEQRFKFATYGCHSQVPLATINRPRCRTLALKVQIHLLA
ncbi:hypothetical protein VTN00DRAFT_4771 [Thermoascus crustaceus]|uniref:uncharacterized protein n=1 Tax=Thermoascus crustaceus TaxID=5088 RepID=UPI003742D837